MRLTKNGRIYLQIIYLIAYIFGYGVSEASLEASFAFRYIFAVGCGIVLMICVMFLIERRR
jgi:hypothetical protein